MYVDAYSSPPNGTVFFSNFSCPSDASSLEGCGATLVSSCDSGPLGLICYILGISLHERLDFNNSGLLDIVARINSVVSLLQLS